MYRTIPQALRASSLYTREPLPRPIFHLRTTERYRAGGAERSESNLRQHRIMGQGNSARDFDTSKSMENAGILDVFPIFHTARLGQKIRRSPLSPLCGVALNQKGRNDLSPGSSRLISGDSPSNSNSGNQKAAPPGWEGRQALWKFYTIAAVMMAIL